jgi:hypothetical protein
MKNETRMAFRLYNKRQLKVGIFIFGFMAVLFLLVAMFGDSLGGQMESNGHVLQKSDPDYANFQNSPPPIFLTELTLA